MPVWQAISLWWTCLELLVSTITHAGFALLLLCRAIVRDIFSSRGRVESEISIAARSVAGATVGALELAEDAKSLVPESANAPLVLVHGIFGFGSERLGGISYWGGCELKENVIVSDVGALASIHDRACELFYQIKGGTVDYGEEHSRRCGHKRYGRTYKGFYPAWDAKHPVHFLGHSSGVQTIRMMHTLLAEQSFESHPETDEHWVLSVTSLSGALNGTTRVYLDGIMPSDGRSLKPLSLLQVLAKGVILFDFLDLAFMKKYYNFGFDHFGLTWREVGLWGFITAFLGYRGPFATGDWILPDLSIQSAVEMNKKLKTYPNTYYFRHDWHLLLCPWLVYTKLSPCIIFVPIYIYMCYSLPCSIATTRTKPLLGNHIPSSPDIHPLFAFRMLQMGSWRKPRDAPSPYTTYKDEDWHANDGALNLMSQLYPMVPCEHPHCPLAPGSLKDGHVMQPGVWYYTIVEADHILYVMDSARAGKKYNELWNAIFTRCREHLQKHRSKAMEGICICAERCMCGVT